MFTERFNKLRKSSLEKVFTKDIIIETWRNIVKAKLRQADIKDLFDYYDFNYNIEERANALRLDILNGTYKVSSPFIYRLEKKYGICRHMVTPQPVDALVVQVIVEHLAKKILSAQPSKNAFFSQDRHSLKKPHEGSDEYGLTISEMWKRMQKHIYNFSEEKELIVTTDLTNFYDSIDTKELRKVFGNLANTDEVLIDLLFRVVEEISWKPDYLPYSNRGLPTSNIEAIRLLAHSFLFEVDEVLKQSSHDNFARWMDDITIGVNSRKEAVETLSSISDIIKSRGLALNLEKTEIYDHDYGHYHFQISYNQEIDLILSMPSSTPTQKFDVEDLLAKLLGKHLQDRKPRYWVKVTKRIITALSRIQSNVLLDYYEDLYLDYPSIRSQLIFYLNKIGYNNRTSRIVIDTLNKLHVYDDVTLSQLCYLVTDWEIPVDEIGKIFLSEFEKKISSIAFSTNNNLAFYCVMWFKAKYNHPDDLYTYIKKYKNKWQSDAFLRRQATSIFSRLLHNKKSEITELLNQQLASGIINTTSVANNIEKFSNIEKLDKKLSSYLFTNSSIPSYPLSKFLVLCSVLNSENIRNNENIKKNILKTITDPFYRRWIDIQYNIS